MFSLENKYLRFLRENFIILFIIIVTFCGILVRYSMKDFVALDAKNFLLPWFDEIENNGKIAGLSTQVGNYNMLYQFIIALMTYIKLDPLYLYKLLSCFFDFILAIGVSILIFQLTRNKFYSVFAYSLVVFSPIVVFNSSAWAQCDSIFISFIIFSLVFILKGKDVLAFICLGISFAFKFQAILILPFFLFFYLYKKRYSIINFFIIPIVMVLLSLPNLISGRNAIDVFLIYLKQTDIYKSMHLNYPSFWAIIADDSEKTYFTLKFFAIILTLFLILSFIAILIKTNFKFNNKQLIFIAFLLAYTSVLFLPAMHERYSYCCEILALVLAFNFYETIPAMLIIYGLSLFTYGHYLFGIEYNIQVLACLNLLVYFYYLFIFIKKTGIAHELKISKI